MTSYWLRNEYDYYPYGKILRTFSDGTSEKYLTTQHERDAETGLDYRFARFYDSDLGRFLGVDPHEENYFDYTPYVYVGNNPISRIDPNGKDWWDKVAGALVAVVDNTTGMNFRQTYPHTNAADYNQGQDIGDIGSVLLGAAMIDGGTGLAAGSVVATGGTGGLSIAVRGPTFVLGGAMAVHGTATTTNGTLNFAAQKGRADENPNGNPTGPSSKYNLSNKKGSKEPNIETNVSSNDFQANLKKGGFKSGTSKDGKTQIYTKDGKSYSVREKAKSTGGPTADFKKSVNNKGTDLKIRLDTK